MLSLCLERFWVGLLGMNVIRNSEYHRQYVSEDVPPSDNFLGALKSKGGAKIRNCQCEILYKIRKVQVFNKIKDSSNSSISK